ncbi:MAG: calcium/sodium antiporter [Acaryochloridaceae cyanobacterium RL_2_7]|nr:calcium/sodium antiporter [Acaryochloridaceae cyanobacterium RL_2_7]
MIFQTIGLLLGGFILLVLGAEVLVRGASRIAAMLSIPPLIIGLTIVAYGTSAPELFVSVQSSLQGNADIALGNVVGSNIFNVLCVLGLSSLIAPLVVSQQIIRLDVPIMVGVSLLLFGLGLDGQLNRPEGIFLFMGGVGYTLFLLWQGLKEPDGDVQEEYNQEYAYQSDNQVMSWGINIGLVAAGFICLALGSDWLVDSASTIARSLGVSDLVIGLTIVAIGTSLPELATSIMASIKGERDIAVGNVVGSNIFNILAVLGVASMSSSSGGVTIASSALWMDIPIMILVAIACLPICFTGNIINRWEGGIFVGYYVLYSVHLVLKSTGHGALDTYNLVIGFGVLPMTLLVFGFNVWQEFQQGRIKLGK